VSYNAAEIEPRDIIRGRVLDTSNDPATEYLLDATYDAILARHDDWRLAGVEIAGRIARMIAAKPISVTSDEGENVRWSDKRADLIAAACREFQAEYDADASGAFDIAEWVVDDFSYRDVLHNGRIREAM